MRRLASTCAAVILLSLIVLLIAIPLCDGGTNVPGVRVRFWAGSAELDLDCFQWDVEKVRECWKSCEPGRKGSGIGGFGRLY